MKLLFRHFQYDRLHHVTLMCLLLCSSCWIAVLHPRIHAQTQAPTTQPDKLDPITEQIKQVELRLKEARESENASEDNQTRIQLLEKMLDNLTATQGWDQQREISRTTIKNLPTELRKLQAILNQPEPGISSIQYKDKSLGELTALVQQAEATLLRVTDEQEQLKREPERQNQHNLEMIKRESEIDQKLKELMVSSQASVIEDEPVAINNLRQQMLNTRQQLLEAESKALKARRDLYQSQTAELTLRRELASRKATVATLSLQQLQELLKEKRREEAQAAETKAREDLEKLANSDPVLLQLAQQNTLLAEQRNSPGGLLEQIENTELILKQTTEQYKQLKHQFENTRLKVETAGLTYAMGQLMKQQRTTLPDATLLQQEITKNQQKITEIQLTLIDLREENTRNSDLKKRYDNLFSQIKQANPVSQQIAGLNLRKQLETQKQLRTSLYTDTDTLFNQLVELNIAYDDLITETRDFDNYIYERIFWIRSANPVNPGILTKSWHGLEFLAQPSYWWNTSKAMLGNLVKRPYFTLLFILLAIALSIRYFMVRPHKNLAEEIDTEEIPSDTDPSSTETELNTLEQKETPQFSLRVPFLKILHDLCLPLALYALAPIYLIYLAWRMGQVAVSNDNVDLDFGTAMANALQITGIIWAMFTLPFVLTLPHRFGATYLQWSPQIIKPVNQALLWVMLVFLPVVFIVRITDAHPNEDIESGLGRVIFCMAMVTLLVIVHFFLRSSRVFGETNTTDTAPLPINRNVWRLSYLMIQVTILLLLVMSLGGYHFTAVHLGWRLLLSLWLAICLVIIYSILLYVISRVYHMINLKREQAEHHQEIDDDHTNNDASRRIDTKAAVSQENTIADEEDDEEDWDDEDAEKIEKEVKNSLVEVIRIALLPLGLTSLWAIWVDILPAFGILNRFHLWTTSSKVQEVSQNADGQTVTRVIDTIVPVTFADLGIAVLIIIGMIILLRSLPTILDYLIISRLPVDRGIQYATRTLTVYVLIAAAIIMAASILGLSWNKMQWLVAAITVGLGFGLQEIFANFVSGLIILFERPVRVGDTVTVGGMTGTVTRMRIRSTTIRDFDNKEHIVPNKTFVTEQLVNWTLSNRSIRAVIPVGIAYGSNTIKARRILLRVAREHRKTLSDPKPQAFFLGFGDSTLNFELRVFVADMEDRLSVIHELHVRIDRAFREADIEIAFPQRDLNIRHIEEPLQVNMSQADQDFIKDHNIEDEMRN